MPAGRNQMADVAQLSDNLLSGQQVIQITSPAADDEVYLMLSPRAEYEVISVHIKATDGDGRCRITIADAIPGVEFDPVNTPADIDTNGDMLFEEGDVLKYDANGGQTTGDGGNVALVGQAIKLVFTEVNDTTAGLVVIIDVELRHLRNVE